MKLIDLSHTFANSMPVYPGDPVPSLTQIADIAHDGYNEFAIATGMHVGTHIDAPFHQVDGGKYLSDIEVDHFIGRGHLIDARNQPSVEAHLLENIEIEKGDIVLVMTGFADKFHEEEYYKNFPELSEEFAHTLVERGVNIVGMDTPSPDRPPFPIHKILLGGGTLIIENLTNLEALEKYKEFTVIAFPPKLETDAAPVRTVAVIDA